MTLGAVRLWLGAVLLLAAAGCAQSPAGGTPGAGDGGEVTTASGGPSAPSAPGAPPASPADTARRVGSVTPEPPVSITLPDGSVVAVRAVSTTANGVLDVPEDIHAAGWWRGGSQIGDPFGSTLIAAHVDSTTQGLGPFAELLGVRSGQRVVITTETLEQTFVIRSLRLRPKGSIAPDSQLHSPAGSRRLTLVTCASPYVPARGGYQNLAVVVARPEGDPVPRSTP